MTEKKSFLQRSKKPLIFLGVAVLILIIVVVNMNSNREKTVKVTIEKAGKLNLTALVSASGEVKPKKSINISAMVPGRIVNRQPTPSEDGSIGNMRWAWCWWIRALTIRYDAGGEVRDWERARQMGRDE